MLKIHYVSICNLKLEVCLKETLFWRTLLRTSSFWWRLDVLIFGTHRRLSLLLICFYFKMFYCKIVFPVSHVSQAFTTQPIVFVLF